MNDLDKLFALVADHDIRLVTLEGRKAPRDSGYIDGRNRLVDLFATVVQASGVSMEDVKRGLRQAYDAGFDARTEARADATLWWDGVAFGLFGGTAQDREAACREIHRLTARMSREISSTKDVGHTGRWKAVPIGVPGSHRPRVGEVWRTSDGREAYVYETRPNGLTVRCRTDDWEVDFNGQVERGTARHLDLVERLW